MIAAHGASTHDVAKQLQFLLCVRLVHHVFVKPDETRGTFATMDGIGHTFCVELASLLQVRIKSPWSEDPKPKASAKQQGAAFVEFGEKGEVTNIVELLTAKSYQVDGWLQRCSDQRRFIVKSLGAQVRLQDDAGAEIFVRAESLLQCNFRKLRDEATVYLDEWQLAEPSASIEWKFTVVEARFKLAMDKVHTTNIISLDGVTIAIAPAKSKGVVAKRDFERAALVLVPMSTNIGMNKLSEKLGAAIDTGITVKDGRDRTLQRKVCKRTRRRNWNAMAQHIMHSDRLEHAELRNTL